MNQAQRGRFKETVKKKLKIVSEKENRYAKMCSIAAMLPHSETKTVFITPISHMLCSSLQHCEMLKKFSQYKFYVEMICDLHRIHFKCMYIVTHSKGAT